ncbi:MAG: hypothetical protein QOG49_98 [Frankiaceae bacterium]|nr:hypothetical protein [Frankiaceae bacterium]
MKRPEVREWAVAGTSRLRSLRRPPAALAVVVLLTGGVTAATVTQPKPRPVLGPGPQRTAPVVGSIAVCPDVVTTTAVGTRVTGGTGEPGAVQVTATALSAGAAPVTLAETGARVGRLDAGTAGGSAVVTTATGPQAGGLAVEQVSRAESGQQFGLSSVRCDPAVADSWYVGAATTITDRSELFLVNPYDDIATVDVTLYTRKGRLDVPGTSGVAVRPRSRTVKKLADWAPDETWVAVHVVVRSGRVSPAVRRTRSVSSVPSGVDWVPRSSPAVTTTVGALPGGDGVRSLLVVNPGLDTLTAHITLIRRDGRFVPIDLADVDVEGEHLLAVDLTDKLGGQSAMVEIETDGAVALAGAYAEYAGSSPGSPSDFVNAGATPVLSGDALLTDNRVGPTVDTALMFSAPQGDAEVTLREVTTGGAVGRTSVVPVRQGQLVVVALSRAFGRADPLPLLVSTSANSAGVYGTRVIIDKTKRGTLVTELSIQSQPLAGVPVPRVTHDPAGWLLTKP